MSVQLAERLRSETRALHTAAERSVFMRSLLRGQLDRHAYCALLRNLHAIYATLEPALKRHAAHPLVAPVVIDGLWRCEALQRDLLALYGNCWQSDLVLEPTTERYVSQLNDVDATRPERLLAHAYVRYLGDLSGGQILRAIVAHGMRWDGVGAVAFYDFGDAQKAAQLMRAFREGLSRLQPDGRQSDAIVDEAMHAFGMHCSLFDELAARWGLVQPLASTD